LEKSREQKEEKGKKVEGRREGERNEE